MYAVTVTFTLVPGQEAAFLPLIEENARASRETEPGCRQFDVCTDPARPGEVFLYELYDDLAAFEAHKETAHFRTMGEASRGMVASRELRCFAEVRG